MKGALPDWQPFSLEPERSSPLELSGMRGPALVILAAPAVDEAGWAVRAAARIAEQRAGRNGRLLLADLDLRHPRLHMQVGADNGEGVTDVLLWGASVPRVSRPVDGGFMFAPAGTAVADTGSALASPRWELLLEGFEAADVELFLYLPWDAPGRDSLLSRAVNVVILAARAEVERLEVPDVEGLRVGAVLGPEEDPGGSEESDAESVAPDSVEDADPGGSAGEGGEGTSAARADEGPPPMASAAAVADETAVASDAPPPAVDPTAGDAPPSEGRARGGLGGRAGVLAVAVLIVLLVAVVAAVSMGLV